MSNFTLRIDARVARTTSVCNPFNKRLSRNQGRIRFAGAPSD
jgi:hypothetical protein